jgi:hypothetical protein
VGSPSCSALCCRCEQVCELLEWRGAAPAVMHRAASLQELRHTPRQVVALAGAAAMHPATAHLSLAALRVSKEMCEVQGVLVLYVWGEAIVRGLCCLLSKLLKSTQQATQEDYTHPHHVACMALPPPHTHPPTHPPPCPGLKLYSP